MEARSPQWKLVEEGIDGRKSLVKTVSSEGRDLLDMVERQIS